MTTQHVVLLAKARRLAKSGEGAATRAAAALSLAEVADAIGCSVTTLWRWERGERSPQGEAAVAWALLVAELQAAGAAA